MENIQLWAETVDWIEIVLNIALIALPVALSGIVFLAGGGWLINVMRWFWRIVRPQVDEVDDPIVRLIADRTGLSPERVLELLTASVDDILGMMPEQGEPTEAPKA